MLMITDIAHEDAHLAVVDFAPVPTPLTLDPDRVRATLGEAAWIEGDDTIGLAQSTGHLRH
jgi:di/tripeptidase